MVPVHEVPGIFGALQTELRKRNAPVTPIIKRQRSLTAAGKETLYSVIFQRTSKFIADITFCSCCYVFKRLIRLLKNSQKHFYSPSRPPHPSTPFFYLKQILYKAVHR